MQVNAAWQWSNFYSAKANGKKLIKLNLDESSIPCYQGRSRGTVFKPRKGGVVEHNLPKGKRRKCLTLVSVISDEPSIQKHMPQILIGNCHTFLKREMHLLAASCNDTLILIRCALHACCLRLRAYVFRQKSAWVDAKLCAVIVHRLAWALERALTPFRDEYQAVLLLDALPAHLSILVLDALSACHVWPLVIPAKTTWALAPLDTHVFSPLKCAIQEYFDKARAELVHGDVCMAVFVTCIRHAIDDVVMGRAWARAFAHNGFALDQQGVSSDLCVATRNATPSIPNGAPTLSQIEACLPRRSSEKAAIIWRRFLQGARERPSVVTSSRPDVVSAIRSPGRAVTFGKTRSQTRALRAITEGTRCASLRVGV